MARVQLTAAMHIGALRYKAGSTLADSQANAVAGDGVWTGLNSTTWNPCMVPLDGPANTMKAASRYAGVAAPNAVSGRDSIDA